MLTNKERLLNLMDRYALDGVVASTPENILYMSGFSSWRQRYYRRAETQVYVVFPRDQRDAPALLIAGGDEEYASHQEIWLKEIYAYGRSGKSKPPEGAEFTAEEERFAALMDAPVMGGKHVEALAELIRKKGLGKSRLGIDEFNLPEGTLQVLGSLLPGARILPASNFFLYVQMVKTAAEIERLRQAARLNQSAADAVLRRCRPGITEGELVSVYSEEISRPGGQVCWLHMVAGRGGNFPPSKDHVVAKGNIFRTDMGCRLEGYHADTCRSACVGTPTDKHRRVFDALQSGVLRSVERLRPGALPSELFEIMLQGVRSGGMPDYKRNFLGHLIGLEARGFPFSLGPAKEVKDPLLPPTTDVPMEPDMVVNIEASEHELGWGSVSVEYTLLVTEKGYEHLIPPYQMLHTLPLT